MNIYRIEDNYSKVLLTQIRNKYSGITELKDALFELGEVIGKEITVKKFIETDTVITPMNQIFNGLKLLEKSSAIVSTKDDFEFFANGIASIVKNAIRGYMDFGENRGQTALTTPVRAIVLPDLKVNNHIDTLIIAKSVLATGCTAISLTNKAVEKYKPKNVIVASIFYSLIGIQELYSEFPHVEIYLIGESDELDENGMLSPGIGNIDSRLKGKA